MKKKSKDAVKKLADEIGLGMIQMPKQKVFFPQGVV